MIYSTSDIVDETAKQKPMALVFVLYDAISIDRGILLQMIDKTNKNNRLYLQFVTNVGFFLCCMVLVLVFLFLVRWI